jgi:signal peptidase I
MPLPAAHLPPVGVPAAAAAKPKKTEADFTLRRFVESAILFVIVVITLRALTLEPFGVPTGSMALTMVGNHKTCICPRCGFPVVVGSSSSGRPDPNFSERAYASAWCPNCGRGDLHLERVREAVGDRLIVDKNLFEMRSPRRWEVAVFRNPSDLTKPYVKRVIGLPGESIQIRDGDVFINNQLLRKDFERTRVLRVLVFDNNYQPPGGWGERWIKGQVSKTVHDLDSNKSDAIANEYLDGTTLKWPATDVGGDYHWVVYRHWLLDEKREETIRDWFAYNGSALQQEVHECHDYSVEFDVETGPEPGWLGMKLTDGANTVAVEIPIGTSSETMKLTGVENAPSFEPSARLSTNGRHHLEFAFVDRSVMLAIDGNEAFAPVDLPAAFHRRGVSRPVWLGERGTSITVRNFKLYRDVHYTPNGRNGIDEPWHLGPNEYFMLGDNSANSEDSRFWSIPGVPAENFLGRPLLLHQPSHWTSLGSWTMQSIDWSRIRWIR